MIRPLRILYFAHSFWPLVGGIEVIAARLLPALVRRGHSVEVVTTHGHDELLEEDELDGVRIHRFALDAGGPRVQLERFSTSRARVSALLRSLQPDVIHLNSISPMLFAILGGNAPKAALLVSIHSDLAALLQGGADTLPGRLLSQASWVTACSASVLDDVRRSAPGVSGKSSVLHGFLPTPPVPPTALAFAPPVVLAIARLIPKKGIDLLIQAVASVVPRFPDIRLVIAGDGESRRSLETQAHSLGVSRRVQFLGQLAPEQIWTAINNATLVAVPSRAEPFGMVALEAAAMGRPVVATRVGGLPEAVLDRTTGVLVEPEDGDDLARGIAWLLDDPDRARRLGERGRLRMLAEFGEESMMLTYEALYHAVAQQRAAAHRARD